MIRQLLTSTLLPAVLFSSSIALGAQFVVELDSPLEPPQSGILTEYNVSLDQSFAAGVDSYAVFTAADEPTLQTFLKNTTIDVEQVAEVFFVNTPTLGGGDAPGEKPRDGHTVFVIERPIPGVGFFGLDKKTKISKGSNAAIEKLGDIIEWDHSYLTSEGTYCVYRADSPETLREHGALAGAPIGKITPVTHEKY